jgi:hypothetical protein
VWDRLGDSRAARAVSAAREGLMFRLAALLSAGRAPCVKSRPVVNVLTGMAMVFLFVQNVSTVPAAGLRLPDWFVAARQGMGLYQNWTMFAPHPEMNSPWPIIVGVRRDGGFVDVYNRRDGVPELGDPKVVSAVYENYRWRKYLSIMEDRSYGGGPADYGLHYARWLCRSWNEGAVPGHELARFKVYFNVKWVVEPGEPQRPIESRLVWTQECFG